MDRGQGRVGPKEPKEPKEAAGTAGSGSCEAMGVEQIEVLEAEGEATSILERRELLGRDEERDVGLAKLSSRVMAGESKRWGERRRRGESRATSSRKAASFLSHMASSMPSSAREGLSRD